MRKTKGLTQPKGQPDDLKDELFEWAGINLKAFQNAPQHGFVMQLLVLLNDLDSVTFLYQAFAQMTASVNSFFISNWRDGVVAFLLRQDLARTAEVLKGTVDKIYEKVENLKNQKPSKKSKPKLLWLLILEDNSLYRSLSELKAFVDSDEFQSYVYVRDKFGAHADLSELKKGLNALLSLGIDEGITVKWPASRRFRAFFVDNVLSQAWQSEGLKIKSKRDPEAAPNIMTSADYRKLLEETKTKLAEFAYQLFHKYCEQNKLYISDEAKLTIADEIRKFNRAVKN